MSSPGRPTPVNQPFARFARQWAARLTTYKRDGTPVATPVNIAVEGDHAFFRTYEQAWKFKRLSNNPAVEIAPSTFRGTATGPAQRATARLLTGPEADHAAQLIDEKHAVFQGMVVRSGHRLRHYTTRHFELRPVD